MAAMAHPIEPEEPDPPRAKLGLVPAQEPDAVSVIARGIVRGALVGWVASILLGTPLGMVAGLSFPSALGLAAFVSVWGGLGFGAMMGGTLGFIRDLESGHSG